MYLCVWTMIIRTRQSQGYNQTKLFAFNFLNVKKSKSLLEKLDTRANCAGHLASLNKYKKLF